MVQKRRWRPDFGGILEWSAVDKGALLLVFVIPLYVQYILWAGYVMSRDDRTLLTDIVFINAQYPVFAGFILGAVGLLGVAAWLRRRRPGSLVFQLLCASYYGLTLVYCGYIIGSLNFASGVVLLGAPLVGFILLDRRVVYGAWLLAMALVVGLAYAGASGLIAHAPGIMPPVPGDSANQLFWTTSTLFFAAPHILFIVLLGDFMLGRWREREMAFRNLSFTDPLTGVHNRRSILQQLEREVAKRHRRGAPVSVVLLDLDHFKRINDTWGHPTGDLVLRHTAKTLQDCLRQSDALGRVGGEEFLLLLPDTDAEGAHVIAERCRARLAAAPVTAENGQRFAVTASFGIASNARDADIDVNALISVADGALYRAKEGGRNRVEAG